MVSVGGGDEVDGEAKGKLLSMNWTCLEVYTRPEVISKQRYSLWVSE